MLSSVSKPIWPALISYPTAPRLYFNASFYLCGKFSCVYEWCAFIVPYIQLSKLNAYRNKSALIYQSHIHNPVYLMKKSTRDSYEKLTQIPECTCRPPVHLWFLAIKFPYWQKYRERMMLIWTPHSRSNKRESTTYTHTHTPCTVRMLTWELYIICSRVTQQSSSSLTAFINCSANLTEIFGIQ